MADPTPPGPPPYQPLLRPGGRCFHCGAAMPGGGACPSCGGDALLTEAQEAGRIAYLLRALSQAVAEGRLASQIEQRLSAPFRERLAPGSSGVPAAGFRPVTPRPAPAPTKPVNFLVLWANALLYLGAFFVVITALVFLLAMGGLGRTILSAFLAALFLGAGLICRRIEMVRSAGSIFTGTGALVVPLVFVALANHLSGNGPLTAEQIWLAASLCCAVLYVALAAFGLGRFYAVLALLATSSAFLACFNVAEMPSHWLPAWFAAQALFLCCVHHAAKDLLSRPFGPLVLVWGVLWTLPALLGLAVVCFDDAHPIASVGSLILLSALAALNWWRLQDVISPLGLGLFLLALNPTGMRALHAPDWASGVAAIPLASAYVGFWWWRRGSVAASEFLALGLLAGFVAPLWPVYQNAHPAGFVVGAAATLLLATAATLMRQPLLLFPPGVTLAVGWWYLLQLLPFDGTGAVDLGLGYLPVVVGLSLVALAMPMAWPAPWRATVAILAGVYAVAVAGLVSPSTGALASTLALLTLLGSLMVARWQVPWLLAVPGFTAMCLVLTSLRHLAVRPEASGPAVLLLALICSGAGIGLRAAGASNAFSLAFRLLGTALGGCAFLVAFRVESGVAAAWSAHLTAACLLVIAGLIAVEGVWKRVLLYPASMVLMAAVLWEIAALQFQNLQCYAVPLALYFALVAMVSSRDSQLDKSGGVIASLTWVLCALTFGLASFLQSLGEHSIRYAVILLVESLGLLALGLLVRRRGLLAAATTLLVLGGVRLLFLAPALILPALGLAGVLLLVVGFVVLVFVGLKQRGKETEPPV